MFSSDDLRVVAQRADVCIIFHCTIQVSFMANGITTDVHTVAD